MRITIIPLPQNGRIIGCDLQLSQALLLLETLMFSLRRREQVHSHKPTPSNGRTLMQVLIPRAAKAACTSATKHVGISTFVVLSYVILWSATPLAAVQPSITILPETSPVWPAGTDFDGFVSSSSNPSAPFLGQSVHFQGWARGGSQEQRLSAYLVYRAKLEFPQEVRLRTVMVSGAAFNGPDNVIRVLDSNMKEIAVEPTFGANSHSVSTLVVNALGKVFYVDEFDTNTDWRFRDLIQADFALIDTAEPTITILPETSPAWPAGTDFDGFVSSSSNPSAPFLGQSVHFQGWARGGSQEQRLSAYLVYRAKLEFPQEVRLRSVIVSGAAFNGPDSVLRVLDGNMQEIAVQPTFGGNSHNVNRLDLNALGKVFFLDEFDTSTDWRYRDLIQLTWDGCNPNPVVGPGGHYYQIVQAQGIAWPDANAAASAQTLGCLKGHLAVIASPEEDAFIDQLRSSCGLDELWVGGYQPANEIIPTASWTWVLTGESFPGVNGVAYLLQLAGERAERLLRARLRTIPWHRKERRVWLERRR